MWIFIFNHFTSLHFLWFAFWAKYFSIKIKINKKNNSELNRKTSYRLCFYEISAENSLLQYLLICLNLNIKTDWTFNIWFIQYKRKYMLCNSIEKKNYFLWNKFHLFVQFVVWKHKLLRKKIVFHYGIPLYSTIELKFELLK